MRIVLDSNVVVSGLLVGYSPPGRLVNAWLDGDFLLVTSRYQLDELALVFTYDKLKSRISDGQAAAFLENASAKALVLEELPSVNASPDPKDNPILAAALAGNADLVVSGDRSDMLLLGHIEGIPIVTAREAVNYLK